MGGGVVRNSGVTAELLEQLRGGDVAAFDRLLDRHRRYLRQTVELRLDPRLRTRLDPSDVVQDAQLEATRRIDDYLADVPMPFRLWLRQLALDRLAMARRRHLGAARRSVRQEVAAVAQSSVCLAERLLAAGPAPDHALAREELAARVRRAVNQLADADREVLLMRTFEGLSFDEVGALLGIESAAARKRHGRALLRLGRLLADEGLSGFQQ